MTGTTTPDFAALAERFGTPLYVYDADELTRNFRELRERLHPAMSIFYSLKANPNVSVCGLLHTLGANAEVSSLVELRTALAAGVAPQDVLFLGPGKSRGELEACLELGVRAVVVESVGELRLLDGLAQEAGTTARVVLRVNPSFQVKGSGLTMGGKPRQFGIDEQQILDTPEAFRDLAAVRVVGVQAYMGTRILDESTIVENTTRIFELAERLAAHVGFPLELVDVGGGLGVAYFERERDLDVQVLTDAINPVVEEFAARHPGTDLVMELGRYLVATCGSYVARVRYVKESMGERFAVADGGTNHHMAAVGIGSFVKRNFPMRMVGRDSTAEAVAWNVTGPLCTPNDTIGKAVALPADLAPGDLVAVDRSGAYGATASPVHFLSHGYPAEVLVTDGDAYLVRRPDTVEDLLGNQVFHDLSDRVERVAPGVRAAAGEPEPALT
ncbi:diaminopimelate decarboxylase [Cellulosimicrobium marinum]|uniref:diaminopimelate decarboxylase n=1 Tax=Cellulosimicrobium marinum TaxID=1638992 RepID=UPI001E437755|nr:diaminopimelate decarboxylase [Cellulosimicrobium marinum]MCB7135520.1 diaminopimelate decarboxylase [Cellulosimicrobium marinum]